MKSWRHYDHLKSLQIIGLLLYLTGLFVMFPVASAAQTMNFSYVTGCAEGNIDPACLKCGIRGCMKCPNLILVDDRRCVNDCPTGFTEIWSSAPDYMGRICYPVGLSGSFLTALVGVTLGAILCFTMLLVAASLIRKKHRRRLIRNALIDDSITRHEFLRQLSELRPQSEYFLQMLNDTRRQIRKLHLSGDAQSASIYNPVIRDLAKILILLNRPVELLQEPPHDWNRLYSWAERALDCYKPQIEQLIEFLQTSTTPYDARLVSSQHSTFKSQQSATSTNTSSNSQTQQLLGSLISLHELEEQLAAETNEITPPQSSSTNAFGDAFDHVKDYLSSSPGVRSSTIWLEDEFFRLGLRPQDEITTEL